MTCVDPAGSQAEQRLGDYSGMMLVCKAHQDYARASLTSLAKAIGRLGFGCAAALVNGFVEVDTSRVKVLTETPPVNSMRDPPSTKRVQ